MNRVLKRIASIGLIAAAGMYAAYTAFAMWSTWHRNYEVQSMHEGRIVVDAIKAHDPLINATWTSTDDARPNVVIRNVFDRKKQDEILEWAKTAKSNEHLQRSIALDFQKEMPHSSEPDVIVRSEQL